MVGCFITVGSPSPRGEEARDERGGDVRRRKEREWNGGGVSGSGKVGKERGPQSVGEREG